MYSPLLQKKILFLLLLSIILSGCEKDNSQKIKIDPAFQPFVDSYINEADKRGINVDLKNDGISLEFGEPNDDASGTCWYATNHIVIRESAWNQIQESAKERLIFHELGHCHLNRRHIQDTLSNGEWKSIMRGVPKDESISTFINFTGLRREYYIDELFDENTPSPDWLNITRQYDEIPESQKEVIINQENITEFFRSLDLSNNFEIEITFEFTNAFNQAVLGFAWGNLDSNNSMIMRVGLANNVKIFDLLTKNRQTVFDAFPKLKLNESNTLTIQKIDDFNFYFVNKKFITWSEFTSLPTGHVQILNLSTFKPNVSSFTVKRLLN